MRDFIVAGIGILLGGIITWAVSAFYYRKEIAEKAPVWAMRTATIVSPGATEVGLSIHYQTEPVPTASVSEIAVWNNGRRAIDGADIGEVQPLRIQTGPGVSLLNVVQIAETNVENQFQPVERVLAEDGQWWLLRFKYLANQDGALFRVLHTGTTTEAPTVDGGLRESSRLRRVRPTERDSSAMRRFVWVALSGTLIIILGGLTLQSIISATFTLDPGVVIIAVLSAFIVTGFLFVSVAWLLGASLQGWFTSRSDRPPWAAVPPALRKGMFAD